MLNVPSGYNHIVLDEKGTARIAGTRYKVRMLAVEHTYHGWSPQELKWQHPEPHSGADSRRGLAFYDDHKADLDEQNLKASQEANEMLAKVGHPVSREESNSAVAIRPDAASPQPTRCWKRGSSISPAAGVLCGFYTAGQH